MPQLDAFLDPPICLPTGKILSIAAVAVAVLAAGLVVGTKELGSALRLAGATTEATPIPLTIGRDGFSIPANAIRFAEQRTTSPQGEADLYLRWPDMTGFAAGSEEVFHDPEARSLLFLRLTAAEAPGAASESSATSPNEAAGPASLLRSLRAGLPGIASQEALYRTPAGRSPPYEASCLDGADPIMAADCMREMQIGPGLRLRYRFSHRLLPQWDRIDRAVLAYIEAHRRS